MVGYSFWLFVREEDEGRDFQFGFVNRVSSKEGDIGLRGGGEILVRKC